MHKYSYHLTFLTPCFCAGADQTRAELRPAAIRGQLRWWFRCLGGNATDEAATFGAVQGGQPKASNLIVRVRSKPKGGDFNWHNTHNLPKQGFDPRVYLLGFFCGRTNRLQAHGALPPGSEAEIECWFKKPPTALAEETLRVFFSIGALGFRATRGAGAFSTKEHTLTKQSWAEIVKTLEACEFHVSLLTPRFGDDWVTLLRKAGEFLKNGLRGREGLGISAGSGGKKANPLGSAEPRQASVLHLRPVKLESELRLALIEGPHEQILGKEAKRAHGDKRAIIVLAKEKGLLRG